MIETYTDTVTEIEALGGAIWSVTTQTRVCDRCGFQKSIKQLTKEEKTGRKVCKDCLDNPTDSSESVALGSMGSGRGLNITDLSSSFDGSTFDGSAFE